MTFNFDVTSDTHESTPHLPAARTEVVAASEEPRPRSRQPNAIASDVLVVSSTG